MEVGILRFFGDKRWNRAFFLKIKEFRHGHSLFPLKILKWHQDAKPEVHQKKIWLNFQNCHLFVDIFSTSIPTVQEAEANFFGVLKTVVVGMTKNKKLPSKLLLVQSQQQKD